MIKDAFGTTVDSVIAPASTCFAIIPSDTVELPIVTKAIYVGETGNIAVLTLANSDFVTFANVQAGTILDIRARQIRAAGTSAASLVGLA